LKDVTDGCLVALGGCRIKLGQFDRSSATSMEFLHGRPKAIRVSSRERHPRRSVGDKGSHGGLRDV
jgi:hypothetical protein